MNDCTQLFHGTIKYSCNLGEVTPENKWGFPLGKIKTKVYFWFCEMDRSVPPAMGKYLSDTVPDCDTVFVPYAGHLWVFDRLREVLEKVVHNDR